MTNEEIKCAVREAIKDEMNVFYVEREQHYQDHEFLKGLREFRDSIKSTSLKTILSLVITALAGLLVFGFIMWGKTHLH